jgi:hypothetical protein
MTTILSTTSNYAYLELVSSFPLRPIRTRSAHQRAKMMLRTLIGKRGSAVRDYKTVLASLIAEYEKSSKFLLDTSKVTAGQIVLHLLDERKMSVRSLVGEVGIPQTALHQMLTEDQGWTKSAIIRIADFLRLPAHSLLR